jgi:beta-galactosidase
LCDEWGIYLTAEANVECHGLRGKLDKEPRCEKDIVARNVANVENCKNHASVIMWSLGNECSNGSNFVSALNAVKAIDSSRPTHYEPFHDNNPADVDSRMYRHVDEVEKVAKDPKLTKPYYLCEYAHAMFNSMGGLGEYNDLFDKYPALLGGAIWEWQDQGLWNKRDPNHPILAYGGGFGEVPNDHYFIHKGVVFSDRSPKPNFAEVKRVYQWIGIEANNLTTGEIKIRNKFQFIGLDGFKAGWTVSEDGVVIDSGTLGALDIAPFTEKTVRIPYKKIAPKPGAEYFLRVAFTETKDRLWAKAGYEMAAAQFKLPVEAPASVADSANMRPVKLAQDARQITVTGNGFSIVFDKTKGTIAQLNRDGVNLLMADGGPRLHLWRAPHQTDDMWAYNDWSKYGITDLKWTTQSITAEPVGNSAVRITTSLQGEGKNGFSVNHSAVYTVYGDGAIAVDNSVTPVLPNASHIPLARLGVRLLLDKRLDEFTYLGRGPMENYADRKRGSDVGLYSSSVREQMTPYAKPMECGNHEDVRWAAVSGTGLPGLLAQAQDGLLQAAALPYTDEEMTPVEYSIDLPKSTATVFMVSAHTLGAGSNGCGPRPNDSCIVWSDPAAFSYVLRLIPAGEKFGAPRFSSHGNPRPYGANSPPGPKM